jgi:hypothetical protein
MRNIYYILLILLLPLASQAQEIKCKAIVNANQLQNVDKKIFNTLEQAIETFMNTRRWTGDSYENHEKIDVVVSLILNANIEGVEGGYTGNLSIQSSRPVFNATYTSPITNYVDNGIAIKYIQFQPLDFNDNQVSGSDALASNLPALLAYYTYIIIGLDYDSFSMKGGTTYFNKALNVVNNAPENNRISGWKPNEGNNRNRYWLTDQLLNNRFANFRKAFYAYHRQGLDELTSNPENARTAINNVIQQLATVNQENPTSILLQFFFNAKSEELMEFITNAKPEEKQQLIPLLSQMNVQNAQKYFKLMKN